MLVIITWKCRDCWKCWCFYAGFLVSGIFHRVPTASCLPLWKFYICHIWGTLGNQWSVFLLWFGIVISETARDNEASRFQSKLSSFTPKMRDFKLFLTKVCSVWRSERVLRNMPHLCNLFHGQEEVFFWPTCMHDWKRQGFLRFCEHRFFLEIKAFPAVNR